MILSDLESDWDSSVDHKEATIAFRLTRIRPVLHTNRIRCWIILEEPNRHVYCERIGGVRSQVLQASDRIVVREGVRQSAGSIHEQLPRIETRHTC